MALCLSLLFALSYFKLLLPFFYGLIILQSTAGAFLGPAPGALVANIVGTFNGIGELESGVAAQFLGPAVAGGEEEALS